MKRRRFLSDRTAFIGRDRELAQLDNLFEGGAQVVTLAGAAGIGKTRLAVRYAANEGTACGFCDLSAAREAEDLFRAVGEALDVRLQDKGEGLEERLGQVLALRGDVLIVLDNAEHMIEHVVRALLRWTEEAPLAAFLVTSRERLRLDGEHVFVLAPLETPPSGATDLDAIASTAAVELFVERARRVLPEYALTPSDAPRVAELVRRLDGLPLAIELCAARMGLLALPQLLAMIPAHLDLLSDASRGGGGRYATLRAAIEASWALLEPHEAAVLARCSVFRGGFGLEAAQSVALVASPEHADATRLDVIQRLVDKSLIQTEAGPDAVGERRYRLLQSVAELAWGKLSPLEQADVRAAHASYFLARTRQWAAAVDGHEGAQALGRLALELDNVLSAHAWCRGVKTPDALAAAVELLLSVEAVVLERGPTERYARLLAQSLDAAADDHEPGRRSLWARAWLSRGQVSMSRGEVTDATAAYQRALERATDAVDRDLTVHACIELASTHAAQGRVEVADGLLAKALAEADGAGACDISALAPQLESRFRRVRAFRLARGGRPAEALADYEAALRLAESSGNRRVAAMLSGQMGSRRLELGDLVAARASLERAVEILAEFGDTRLGGHFVGKIGVIDLEEGRIAEAEARFHEAIAAQRRVGDRHLEAFFIGALGDVALERGDGALAYRRYAEAATQLERVGDVLLTGISVGRLAAAAALLGRRDEATRELERARQLLQRGGGPWGTTTLELLGAVLLLVGPEPAPDATREVQARIDRARTTTHVDDHGRFVIRLLQRLLRRDATGPTSSLVASAEADPDGAPALVVGREGRFFRAPNGPRVDLGRRGSLRRILHALAERHAASPGLALGLEETLAAGWPGERMRFEAGRQRTYAAIARLRRLGLEGMLVTVDEGYLLDDALRVVRDDR